MEISKEPLLAVLRIRIRDPGSCAFLALDPEPRTKKIRIRDQHLGSYFRRLSDNFWVKKTNIIFCKFSVPNPWWKNSDPGPGIQDEKSFINTTHTYSIETAEIF
jgi:hypothetical protein